MSRPSIRQRRRRGSILIFCVGVNLIWGKTFRVANMLPAVIVAMAAAFMM